MVRSGIAGVLDAKIVDNQREHNRQVGMSPEQRRAGNAGISVLGEIQSEAVVGDDVGLLDTRHAF